MGSTAKYVPSRPEFAYLNPKMRNRFSAPVDMQYFLDRSIPEPNTGCWLWFGTALDEIRGVVSNKRKGEKQRWRAATRVLMEIVHGRKILETELALHKCDNGSCVNPEHLYLGDQRQNVDDMVRRGRVGITRGERNHRSKATDEMVVAIRSDQRTVKEMERAYGLGRTAIFNIRSRKSWSHVR
jgi:hypothetical protein